ncbi:TetR/AcrR family transcriptional regulator [Parabacteroides johnsonii]|uniref:TetR/AcrR family transcriptional regulator n=2 Tax=Parabacteroides johnsonii TaxID=387661 RepID=A0AAW6I5H8_9BACT|nr:TetR/AcrR family transcriptional regulator [Parabacteroides johnsonii]MDC7150949.1 TetR/AcrR family transcriptional regulator [Parabacteroides johnsonii]MDC7158537.1 TetR/AcrR family transcriptional regulator [Parabacteroides johnsonii]
MELKATEKRLLEAVSKIIEEEGFTKIGINRIARQAQCDKVLIYRYFGGLDGLLVAWAKQYDFYSFAYSEFISQIEQAETSNLGEIIKAVLLKQLEYLKDNQLMQELYVWELSGNSSFRAIQVEREKNGYKLQLELEKRLGDSCRDCNFHITIIIAAINHIILFTRQYNMFNGIDFSKPEAWDELKNVISDYVDTFVMSRIK